MRMSMGFPLVTEPVARRWEKEEEEVAVEEEEEAVTVGALPVIASSLLPPLESLMAFALLPYTALPSTAANNGGED